MKKTKIAQLFAVTALFSGLANAQNIDFDRLPSLADIKARSAGIEIPAPSASAPQARAQKEWTVMVFINGKNNLSRYVEIDMNEMEQIGSTDKVNIVVEAGKLKYTVPDYPDYPGGWDNYDNPWGGGMPPYMKQAVSADWYGVRRYYVQKDADTATLGSQLLQELPKADMGDWNHLVEYVQWAKANYPAKKYMLVVWNHGDGWKTKSLGRTPSIAKGISYDDETGNGITTVQLGQALAKIGGVDVYASDACLMQMAEVVYELKDHAPVIVGSEETEPGDGWDYTAFLSRMMTSNLAPEAVATAAVEGYSASYSAKGKAVTMSAVRSSEAEPLRLLTDQWVTLAMTQDKAKLREALNETTKFEGVDARDLLHFLNLAGSKLPALQAKGTEISALVSGRMIIRNVPTGDSYKNAGGLAIYLPSYNFDANYSKLTLSKTGNWDEFMQWMTAK